MAPCESRGPSVPRKPPGPERRPRPLPVFQRRLQRAAAERARKANAITPTAAAPSASFHQPSFRSL
jgi:hypothetical protein